MGYGAGAAAGAAGCPPCGTAPCGVDVDVDAGVATRSGRVLDLTATELRLLSHLAAHRGRTLSKTQLLTAVWGYDDYDPNLVEVHVSALRRKLGAPRLLHTARGLGYMLRAEP